MFLLRQRASKRFSLPDVLSSMINEAFFFLGRRVPKKEIVGITSTCNPDTSQSKPTAMFGFDISPGEF